MFILYIGKAQGFDIGTHIIGTNAVMLHYTRSTSRCKIVIIYLLSYFYIKLYALYIQ